MHIQTEKDSARQTEKERETNALPALCMNPRSGFGPIGRNSRKCVYQCICILCFHPILFISSHTSLPVLLFSLVHLLISSSTDFALSLPLNFRNRDSLQYSFHNMIFPNTTSRSKRILPIYFYTARSRFLHCAYFYSNSRPRESFSLSVKRVCGLILLSRSRRFCTATPRVELGSSNSLSLYRCLQRV